MIRLLKRIVSWLEARFPEKLVVTAERFEGLTAEWQRAYAEVDLLRDELNELKASHAATVDRASRLEATAVHKGAVQEIVQHLQEQKDELVSLKANLGWSNRGAKAAEIAAMLNGEPINHGE